MNQTITIILAASIPTLAAAYILYLLRRERAERRILEKYIAAALADLADLESANQLLHETVQNQGAMLAVREAKKQPQTYSLGSLFVSRPNSRWN